VVDEAAEKFEHDFDDARLETLISNGGNEA
jgi:hypothetical protein